MSIVNRTLDPSEQKKIFSENVITATTGTTFPICVVPWPANLTSAQVAAFGVSNAPTFELSVQRFIVGSGVTTWVLATGTSNLRGEFGTSGVGLSAMLLQGSSLLVLQANDAISLTFAGTNAAAKSLILDVVLQPIQDIKQHWNINA